MTIWLHRSTAQEILADLGKPSKLFYKEEDKMKIHSVTDDGAVLGKPPVDKGDKPTAYSNKVIQDGQDEEEKGQCDKQKTKV